MPDEAGNLFRFFTFLGSETITSTLFEAAAKSLLLQNTVRQNSIPSLLKPFVTVASDKWDDNTFERAKSYLIQEQFLAYTTEDQRSFTLDQEMRTRTLETLDGGYKMNLAGWAIAFVSIAGGEHPQVVTLRQLNHCCELARSLVSELEENGPKFEFLS